MSKMVTMKKKLIKECGIDGTGGKLTFLSQPHLGENFFHFMPQNNFSILTIKF